jgi:hypothetical protein
MVRIFGIGGAKNDPTSQKERRGAAFSWNNYLANAM